MLMLPSKSGIEQAVELIQNDPKEGTKEVAERAASKCDPLTKRLTGNQLGTKRNLQGLYEIKRAQLASDINKVDTPEVEQLRENQCLPLKNQYDPSLIDTIAEKFDKVVEDPEKSLVRSEYDGAVYSRIPPKLWEQIPEVKELLTPEIKFLVRQYYGSHFRVRHLHGWRNRHVPDDVIDEAGDIFGDFWHNDGKPTSWFKLFVVLQDTTEDHGPLHVLPEPATESVVKSDIDLEDYERVREKLRDKPAVLKLTGEAGSAVVGNTEQCLHRAGFPEEGKIRDIIQFQFEPAREPLPEDWQKDVMPKPIEQEWLSSNEIS